MILDKKQMSEEDIKLQYITPAITSKWNIQKITMETQITDGRVNLKGNFVFREPPKRADYVLYLNANNPIAIVEAKDNNHSVSFGLQQAMTYAQMLDLPFAYSSNGDGFMEHDFLTGTEREIGLDEFPTEEELVARYKGEYNCGAGITPAQQTVLDQPYYSSQSTYPPRYYQRIAINRTLDAIAQGRDRLLLVMATGTGKTYTAFQIVYRLLQTGMKRKILYLVDRNFLADTSIQQDFAPLEKVIHKINYAKDDAKTISAYLDQHPEEKKSGQYKEPYDDFDTLRERLIECIPDFRLRLKLDPKSEQVVFAADVNSVFDIAWYTFARLLTEDPSLECLGSDGRRHGGIMICCHHCGQFFYRKAKHQQYCDRPECQKARNAKNQRDFRKRKAIEKAQAEKKTFSRS